MQPSQADVVSESISGLAGVEQVKDQRKYLNPIFDALSAASVLLPGCESGPKQPKQPKQPEAAQRPVAPERPARPAQPRQPQAAPPVPVSGTALDMLAAVATPEIRVE